MKASVLLESLLEIPDFDADRIQEIYDTLPVNAKVAEFRAQLVQADVLTFTQIMNVFVNNTLLPKSEGLLKKLEEDREKRVHYKPEEHKQKYHITERDQLISDIAFAAGELPVHIPEPDLSKMKFHHSDEKQAVMLAIDMAGLGELGEAEIVLLETLESFGDSIAAFSVLCWIYICTGHTDQSEFWANEAMAKGMSDQKITEILCLSEQLQNKHLLATSHYQKLLQLKRVKSIWYLLLAYSQERSECRFEAIENYNIYSQIGSDQELKGFAIQQLQELGRS